MTIKVDEMTRNEQEEWNRYVERAPHATPFHHYAALELFADFTNADLHPLVGYKGQEPVGLLPLFETERGPFTQVRSPPLEMESMHLGPLRLNYEGSKQRKSEKDHRRFVDACGNWIETTVDPDMIQIRCNDRYTDVRPYIWNDYEFEIAPLYIYVVDLTLGEEVLFDGLAKEARRKIRNTDEDAYEIVEAGVKGAQMIIRQIRDRHEEQGETYGLTPEFIAEFYEILPDEQIHPYCLRIDGELVSGLLTLGFGDTMHVWQGGAKTDADVPVNELLYWHVIDQAASNDFDRLDLTTAMIPSLAEYKAKFGPESKVMFEIQWQSQTRQIAEFGYKRLPETGRNITRSLL